MQAVDASVRSNRTEFANALQNERHTASSKVLRTNDRYSISLSLYHTAGVDVLVERLSKVQQTVLCRRSLKSGSGMPYQPETVVKKL